MVMDVVIMRLPIAMAFVSIDSGNTLNHLLIVCVAAAYVCDEVMATSSPYIHSSQDVSARC